MSILDDMATVKEWKPVIFSITCTQCGSKNVSLWLRLRVNGKEAVSAMYCKDCKADDRVVIEQVS